MNTSITLNIRKISNGYLVSTSGMTINGPGDENYFASEGEMAEALPALATGALERAEAAMREMMDQQNEYARQARAGAQRALGGVGYGISPDIQNRGN